MKKYFESINRKILLVTALISALILTTSVAYAAMTLSTDTISGSGALNLNPTGQPVTVNGDLTATGPFTAPSVIFPAPSSRTINVFPIQDTNWDNESSLIIHDSVNVGHETTLGIASDYTNATTWTGALFSGIGSNGSGRGLLEISPVSSDGGFNGELTLQANNGNTVFSIDDNGDGNGRIDLSVHGGLSLLMRQSTNTITFNASGGIVSNNSITAPTFSTATNCADSAGAAACVSAAAGAFVIDTGSTSVVVSTTAVTANSEIKVQFDSSLGTRLGITCNTAPATVAFPSVTARTAGTSFTLSITGTVAVNPACFSYSIVN